MENNADRNGRSNENNVDKRSLSRENIYYLIYYQDYGSGGYDSAKTATYVPLAVTKSHPRALMLLGAFKTDLLKKYEGAKAHTIIRGIVGLAMPDHWLPFLTLAVVPFDLEDYEGPTVYVRFTDTGAPILSSKPKPPPKNGKKMTIVEAPKPPQ